MDQAPAIGITRRKEGRLEAPLNVWKGVRLMYEPRCASPLRAVPLTIRRQLSRPAASLPRAAPDLAGYLAETFIGRATWSATLYTSAEGRFCAGEKLSIPRFRGIGEKYTPL